MRVIEQSIAFEEKINGEVIVRKIENAARTCYKSEHSVGDLGRAEAFVRGLIARGHDSTLEHVSLSARVVTNRGVSHEWVRHRVGCSYSQESTRYCNYGSEKFGAEITVVWPWYLGPYFGDCHTTGDGSPYAIWAGAMEMAERYYFALLNRSCSPQEARGVLPNDLKTEFVVTMTLRAWRHFLKLRCAPAAHPQIRDLAYRALNILHREVPVVVEDIWQGVLPKETK